MKKLREEIARFRRVMKTPSMYMPNGNDFDCVSAFLCGAEFQGSHIFENFSEWLTNRYGINTSEQHWSGGIKTIYANLQKEDDESILNRNLLEFLFHNIDDFFSSLAQTNSKK